MAEAVYEWLKVRARAMRDVATADDERWLFIAETGSRNDESRFLKTVRRVTAWCGISSRITLHSLRRFSINELSN